MNNEIFNRPDQKKFRQYLRGKARTRAEFFLWKFLKNSQMGGNKFRRQHGIGPYIVDFYCPRVKLVIEIDGETHGSPLEKEYDKKREEYLRNLEIKVIRFNNMEIYKTMNAVIDRIMKELKISNHPLYPLLEKEGEDNYFFFRLPLPF
jgi:very-short-patch-repair endonuclease